MLGLLGLRDFAGLDGLPGIASELLVLRAFEDLVLTLALVSSSARFFGGIFVEFLEEAEIGSSREIHQFRAYSVNCFANDRVAVKESISSHALPPHILLINCKFDVMLVALMSRRAVLFCQVLKGRRVIP